MKTKHFFIALLLTFVTTFSYGQSQAQMNETALINFKKADKELNLTYNKILTDYKSDLEFILNLKTSQKIWIKFRDAEMKVKYPDRKPGYYGTAQPACLYNYKAELTKKRVRELRTWIGGTTEGDVCAGSVKAK